LPFEIAALYATPNGTYVVQSGAGNELLELRNPGAGTLGKGSLLQPADYADCQLPTGECGVLIVGAERCEKYQAKRYETVPDVESFLGCQTAWSRAVVAEDGCSAGIVQRITGQALVVSLPGQGCEPQIAPLEIPPAELVEPAESEFRLILSPNSRWAAIHPTGTSEVPVTIHSTLGGEATSPLTPIYRPERIEFACNADDCTLWALEDERRSPPTVWAVDASSRAYTQCVAPFPIQQLHIASSQWATFTGTDSFDDVQLQRVDRDSGCVGERVPLELPPVCLGSSGDTLSFACSPERDGDIRLIDWGVQAAARSRPFSLQNRLSGGECP
jgi:hypothetical protein